MANAGNLQWRVDGDTLIISGNGNMENYSFGLFGGKAPWNSHRKSVTKVVIENGVTSIGDRAFDDYKNLTSITIPASVTSIGTSAFNNCKSLPSIILPDGVTSVGDYAFDDCYALKVIKLSAGLRSVGKSAFNDCKSLEAITIPAGVTELADRTFDCCKNLTTVKLTEGIKKIGEYVFWKCESLKEINFPEGLVSIGDDAFWYCKNLLKINLPETVTTLGQSTFRRCENLTEITIPAGVTSVGKDVLGACDNLKKIYYAGNPANEKILSDGNKAQIIRYTPQPSVKPAPQPAPVKVETPKKIAVENVPARNDTSSDTLPPGTLMAGELFWKFEDGTLTIFGNGKMKNYDYPYNKENWLKINLAVKKVVIENGVTTIGNNAFGNFVNLSSVTIPDTVISIGNEAFKYCYNLTEITLPKNITSIGEKVFYNCHDLKKIKVPKTGAPFDGRLLKGNDAKLISYESTPTSYSSGVSSSAVIHITEIGKKSALGDIVFIANYGCDSLSGLNYIWRESSSDFPYKIVHSPANDGTFRKLMEDYKNANKNFDRFFNEFKDIMKQNRMRISRIPGSALAQAEIKFCNDTKGLVWDTIFSVHNIIHVWAFDAVKYWYEKPDGLRELRGKSSDIFNPLNVLGNYRIEDLVAKK